MKEPKNSNYIFINGGAYTKVKKALRQWIQLYSADIKEGSIFKIYKNGRGRHIIKAPDELDNDWFFYLVNYLNYPEGIDYKANVVGYTHGQTGSQFQDIELQVYVSNDDREGDNVDVVTLEHERFRIHFDKTIYPIDIPTKFTSPEIPQINEYEIIKSSRKSSRTKRQEAEVRVNERFKILIIAIGIIYTFIFLALCLDWQIAFFAGTLWWLNFGVAMWLFMDYKILRSDKRYILSFLLAAIIFCYTNFVISRFSLNEAFLTGSSSLFTIILLLIQRPLRKIFLAIFHEEPEVDRSVGIQHLAYTLILLLSMIIISVLIWDFFKQISNSITHSLPHE